MKRLSKKTLDYNILRYLQYKRRANISDNVFFVRGHNIQKKSLTRHIIEITVKVTEHSFLVPMRYLSLFSNHWQLGSQNWQGASSTKEDCILICFIGLGTVTMATHLAVNRH